LVALVEVSFQPFLVDENKLFQTITTNPPSNKGAIAFSEQLAAAYQKYAQVLLRHSGVQGSRHKT
jgi:hypothetical protein